MIETDTDCIVFPFQGLMLPGWLLGYHLPADCNRRSWSRRFRAIWICEFVFGIVVLALVIACHMPLEGWVRILFAQVILRSFGVWLLTRRFARVPSMTSMAVIAQTVGQPRIEANLWAQLFMGILVFAFLVALLFSSLPTSDVESQTANSSMWLFFSFSMNAVVAIYLLRNKHRWNGST